MNWITTMWNAMDFDGKMCVILVVLGVILFVVDRIAERRHW